MPGSSPRNVPALAEQFRVYTPDARGHGHTPDAARADHPRTAPAGHGGLPDHRGGRSRPTWPGTAWAGLTALHVALRYPGLVRRLILISASIRPPGPRASDSPWPGLADLVRFLGPGYGEVSPDGEAHFPVVASKVVTMLAGGPALAQAELGGISSRTLLMAGDEDAVSLDDTLVLYNGIPDSELAIVPGTSHFLLREKPALCNAIMLDFLTGAAVPAVPPVRRARVRAEQATLMPAAHG